MDFKPLSTRPATCPQSERNAESRPAPPPPIERHPLRHWLWDEPTWAVLAAARLTDPRRVAHRARCLGLRPHWAGRVRVWSWPELLQLASSEAERLERIERQRRALWRAGR